MISKGFWILESVSEPLHWFQVVDITEGLVTFKNGSTVGKCPVRSVIAYKATKDAAVYIQGKDDVWNLDIRRQINTEDTEGLDGPDPVIHMDRSKP